MFSVTPVEKVGIRVEDAAFLAVEMTVARPQPELVLRFSTNVGIGLRRPRTSLAIRKSRFRWNKTYIHVRGDLWALATRAVSLDLFELGEIRSTRGRAVLA